ncbi:amidohydrolase [Photobacterium sp. TY1-4]|uniref:amidohydrolase n=1 Tax=Photobacterium sp. TY1-4 TaxID=2899122 RepID=UPI0021C086A2|nr:amidohydrolase [Photobacterium sp. TY1-4]UXI03041.1 amidohydrolase [Photobacterium sp. TY1-4]
MSHNHSHQGCAQCACHNPLWTSFAGHHSSLGNSADTGAGKVQSPEDLLPTTSVMYSGGIIRPMIDGSTDTVEAIGFDGGKVAVVGSIAEVSVQMRALGMHPDNHIVLQEKQTLLPGLIEPHVHIVPTALTMGWLDMGPYLGQDLNLEYDLEYLESVIQSAQPQEGEWILGTGVDPALMPFVGSENDPQLYQLDLKQLTEMEPVRPVYLISASLHTAYINEAALELIADALPIEEQDSFRKQVQKQGALQELEQMTLGFDCIPSAQKVAMKAELDQHIATIFDTANQRGVTTMFEAGMRFESVDENGRIQSKMISILEDFRASHAHNVRVGYALLCDTEQSAKALPQFKPLAEHDMGALFQSAVKLVSDGSNQGLTGFQSTPYCCEPKGNYGIFNFSYQPDSALVPCCSEPSEAQKPDYQNLVTTIVEKGWPILIHANGDQAVDYTLDVYGKALKLYKPEFDKPGLDKRHRIEHCSLLSDASVEKMIALGISPSFLIGHVGYWGYAFEEVIFKEKSQLLDRCRTMLDKGARITLHSDLSVTPLGPLRMMEQAVTRVMEKSPDLSVLNGSERITREEALRAITLDAAWQCHIDPWVGSLAQGKLADYVILEDDPIAVEKDTQIRDIRVLQTWVGGKLRYVSNTVQKPEPCADEKSETSAEQADDCVSTELTPA